MLSIDITLVYQIIGFFILLVIVSRFMYGPISKILKERDARIDGATKEAAAIEASVEQGAADYDLKLKEGTLQAMEIRAKIRQETSQQEQTLLEAARTEANAELSKIREGVAAGKDEALDKLRAETGALSKEIAEKVLNRSLATFLIAFLLPAFLLLLPELGFASSGGEGGSSGMGWKIFNFILLVIGIGFAWKYAIRKLFDDRSAEIATAIEEATRAKERADATKKEYDTKLAGLGAQIEHVRNELKLEGESEKEKILAEAAVAADKIRAMGKSVAEQEIHKAREEIRREIAFIAVDMAEEIIKKELTPDDQQRLVKDYLEKVRLN